LEIRTRRNSLQTQASDHGANGNGRLALTLTSRFIAQPLVPISWGELIDKITILEIKLKRITGEKASQNVQREHAILSDLLNRLENAPAELSDLRSDLRAVNQCLWDIEDAIRDKEAQRQFDQEFIDLARSIYQMNDNRSKIKRRMNELLGSDLIEEKQYTSYRVDS
jgi:hypothetical protein